MMWRLMKRYCGKSLRTLWHNIAKFFMMKEIVQLYPPRKGINGVISLAGSKSITNRALIMAALATGTTHLRHASCSEDTVVLLEALKALGVKCELKSEECLITVEGCGGVFVNLKKVDLQIGAAGTAARFLTALIAAIAGSEITISGNQRMKERPIDPLVQALRDLGAEIVYQEREGSLPLLVRGKAFQKRRVAIDGSVSSQYISALLLISPLFSDGLELEIRGDLVSRSYIDMTIAGMAQFGVSVVNDNYRTFSVERGQTYQSQDLFIEGDASGASYFWGIAALSGGTVKVLNIDLNSVQGDVHFAELLGEMGCCVTHGNDGHSDWIAVSGRSPLSAITADMQLMPDTAQTLAVIATCCEGVSKISGLSTLRVKETDRIHALVTELQRLGIKVKAYDDTLEIRGGTIKGACIKTYDDHRMALAFAMLGAKVEGIKIEDPTVVRKSLPSFWDDLKSLGVEVG
ncbi:MAG: 3-phosphoshikimate 1-carboxyvinyltransferase [Bdellovibrionota bacterium]|jgi:3-phosphoshikimate 1-carboxyvinyltransferase